MREKISTRFVDPANSFDCTANFIRAQRRFTGNRLRLFWHLLSPAREPSGQSNSAKAFNCRRRIISTIWGTVLWSEEKLQAMGASYNLALPVRGRACPLHDSDRTKLHRNNFRSADYFPRSFRATQNPIRLFSRGCGECAQSPNSTSSERIKRKSNPNASSFLPRRRTTGTHLKR